MTNTRKIKTPRTLDSFFSGYKIIQRFFHDLEDRDLIGEIYADDPSTHTADSVNVVAGTITSGDVTSTHSIDQVYLVVNESAAFDIRYTFTGLTGDPARIEFVGRYQGNIGHTVTAQFWNYTTTAWVNAVAGGKDFPSSTSDYARTFDYPTDSSDYISGGACIFRIIHLSAPSAAHNFYTDYIAVLEKSLELPVAGTFYPISGLTDGCQNRTIVDGAAGTITVQTIGWYTILLSSSFFGSDSTKFTGHVYVNDIQQVNVGLSRTIGSSGDVGSATPTGCVKLVAGDVVSVKVSSTSSDVFLGVENFNLMIRAIN